MRETMCLALASSASAGPDQREKGFPHALGSVQASAVIWARTLEGKKARGSRALLIPDGSGHAPPLAPSAHRSVGASHDTSDVFIAPVRMLKSGDQNFGPHHRDMGRFEQPSNPFEFFISVGRQCHPNFGTWSSRHTVVPPRVPRYIKLAVRKPGQNL